MRSDHVWPSSVSGTSQPECVASRLCNIAKSLLPGLRHTSCAPPVLPLSGDLRQSADTFCKMAKTERLLQATAQQLCTASAALVCLLYARVRTRSATLQRSSCRFTAQQLCTASPALVCLHYARVRTRSATWQRLNASCRLTAQQLCTVSAALLCWHYAIVRFIDNFAIYRS